MGKVRIPKIQRPSTREIYGRMLAGFADTPQEEFGAYEKAMGPENVRYENYVQQIPPIMVKRRGEWVEPDAGIDVLDFTTDQIPQIPSIIGAAVGGASAGIPGAMGGAMIGEGVRRKIGQRLGVGDGKVDKLNATLAGIGEAMPLAAGTLRKFEISGNTFPFKDKLKKIGAKWLPDKKVWEAELHGSESIFKNEGPLKFTEKSASKANDPIGTKKDMFDTPKQSAHPTKPFVVEGDPFWTSHAIRKEDGSIVVARAHAKSTVNRKPTAEDIARGIAANQYDSGPQMSGDFNDIIVDLTEDDLILLDRQPKALYGRNAERPITNNIGKPVTQAQALETMRKIIEKSY